MSGRSYSVVTTHYGDQFWADLLVQQIEKQDQVIEILIAQNYSAEEILLGWTKPYFRESTNPKVKVLTKENEHPDHASKQHSDLLNWTIQNHSFAGQNIIFFDNDCFPINPDWLDKVSEILKENDAILSMNPTSRFSVHVCFLVLKSEILHKIKFNFEKHSVSRDGNHFELRKETGSDLAFLLSREKHKIFLLEPKMVLGGTGTSSYLNDRIVHMGGQSFANRSDIKRIRKDFYEFLSFEFPKKLALSIVKKPKSLKQGSRHLFISLFIKGEIPMKVIIEGLQLILLKFKRVK